MVAGYALARLVAHSQKGLISIGPAIVLGAVWLAFLPNTCYLLTEWRHFLDMLYFGGLYHEARLSPDGAMRFLAYTAFYALYSGCGMVCFALAIRPLARALRKRGLRVLVPGIALFVLVALGVYLGLILRYNSWDLVTRPGVIAGSIADVLSRPRLGLFILGFAAFLWVAYNVIDIWIDGLVQRMGTREAAGA